MMGKRGDLRKLYHGYIFWHEPLLALGICVVHCSDTLWHAMAVQHINCLLQHAFHYHIKTFRTRPR